MRAPAVKTHAAADDQFKLRLLGRRQRMLFQPEGLRDTGAVRGIGAGAVVDMALLDVQLRISHRARRVIEQHLLLRLSHLAEQVARLLPVIIVDAMVVVRPVPIDRHRQLGEIGLRAVRIKMHRAAQIAVRSHLAVAVIALERAFRGIDRDVVEIDTEPVALGVAIREQPSLEHLVQREADAGHDVGGREGRLFLLPRNSCPGSG
jgi:hypothetical protein